MMTAIVTLLIVIAVLLLAILIGLHYDMGQLYRLHQCTSRIEEEQLDAVRSEIEDINKAIVRFTSGGY